ncbi:ATP-binding protein [Geomonas agri]|uniref:ATPase n=1 Tax=Geomonas agri TaxID=2873702 RepID=UPI001CD772FB|nr:ATPase [Geomonas agri]
MFILGEKLVKEHIITQAQLDEALDRQRRLGGRLGHNLVALGHVTEQDIKKQYQRNPPPPKCVEDTGLDLSFITDLVLKHIVFMGEFRMGDVVDRIKLPMTIVNRALEVLKREKFVEIKGATSYASATYTFKVTESGQKRSLELMDLCRYAGPAPVTLDEYQTMVELQTVKCVTISEETLRDAFSHLVCREDLFRRLGPAITSGKTVFIYGPPGNGKTAIAEAVGRVPTDFVYVPYAIDVGGQIISVFDPVNHIPVPSALLPENVDQRWVLVRRPVVMVGGELTMRMLDLDFNRISKYYEASLQLKANNGIFILDDFGRQQIEPRDILNRWIVPLDRHIDFMTLHTGMKFAVPFDMLVIFATNLDPSELLDEAFLRRIRYKVEIDRPTETEYHKIFKMVCAANEVSYSQEAYDYLISYCYKQYGAIPNACHPRDLIEQIIVESRYHNQPARLTKESIEMACSNYFVKMVT